ncbi:MAG: alpha/beta hydrolase, partial [Chloroflexota bacterium]
MPTSQWVKVNGLNLRYLDYGNAGKPPMVFYHATGFVSELWQPIIRTLQADYHCLALDQRGHGGSDKSATEHTWYWTADDFLKFLEALGLTHVIGIGHSSGATSIAVAAGRKPALVDRAVLIEPTVRPRVVPPNMIQGNSPLIERTRGRRARWPNRETLFATLFARPPYASWTDEMKNLFADHAMTTNANGELELLCAPAIEADIYASFPHFDPWPALDQVRQPLLVIHGTGPSVMATMRVDEVMPALPSAQLVELPDGGHLILMEAPEKIVEAIRAFL